ncbi:MAG: tRNA lysidine(34) synthetase TilS [Rubinisphaera brasiliensis]|uniref:tRNA lysidine(34) synthetase TilS n=1 Tax=Rubinisphaera brasiliensis TaxID=119 RepID=UPI00391AE5E6
MNKHAFLDHLRSRWQAHPNVSRQLMVAVSGGADSVALLRGCVYLAEECELRLVVAHFNHRTRPGENERDLAWLQSLCTELTVPFVAGERDSQASTSSSENELRQARRRFFIDTARSREIGTVCFAHHADDQAETVLHRLCRGTGLAGMTGMQEVSSLAEGIVAFRPLLGLPGQALRDFLSEIDQPHREDATNASSQYTRNRIRQQLTPLLEQIHPGAAANIARSAEQLRESLELQQRLASALLNLILIDAGPQYVRLRRQPLAFAEPLIARDALVQLWTEQNWPRQAMTRAHWQRLLAAAQPTGAACELPGRIRAERRGEMLVLEQADENST